MGKIFLEQNLISTEFLGYENIESESEIISIVQNDNKVNKILNEQEKSAWSYFLFFLLEANLVDL